MRRTIILLLIGAILMAVVVCAPMVTLPLVVAATTAVALRPILVASDDAQPVSLRAVVAFRAPPV